MENQTQIIIEPTARGYKFTLPEWCAPSPNVISGMKVPALKIGYHRPLIGEPYRTFPAECRDAVVDFLNYWYVEANPSQQTRNRNGGKRCLVRVAEAAAIAGAV